MNNSLKQELDRKVERADRFAWGCAAAWGLSFVLVFGGIWLNGILGGILFDFDTRDPPLWALLPFVLPLGPVLVAFIRLQVLHNEQKEGIRYGFPQFGLFTDRTMRACDDRHVSVRLSATLILCQTFAAVMSVPLWLLGLRDIITLDVNAVMMVIGTTPLVAFAVGGLALLWRSDFDQQCGTLTIWNWLRKREFPMSQVVSVDVEYTAASPGVVVSERPSGVRAGYGPLWRVYVALDDEGDCFKIHIATVESRRHSAQRMADAIAEICECPIRDLQAEEKERIRLQEQERIEQASKRGKRKKRGK